MSDRSKDRGVVFEIILQLRQALGRIKRWIMLGYAKARLSPSGTVHVDACSGVPSMPTWLQEELLEIGYLDPDLVPPGGCIDRYQFYSVPSLPAAGAAYFRLLEQMGGATFSHVLVVPWLKQGGADRGILYHAKAIIDSSVTNSLLVLGTEPADSPWVDRLPSRARYVSFGRIAEHLSLDDQVRVLVRLLVQQRPRVVHVVNSRVGWEAVRQSGLALSQYSSLFASLFCDDYDVRMMPVGYARDYLRDCHAAFHTIFCDNSRYPMIWNEDLGIPRGAFTVLPFPYDGELPAIGTGAKSAQCASRVLWAGRLDRQKRPDILASIAESMPHVMFDVFGAQVMSGGGEVIERLRLLPNVVVHGEFERLEAVASPDHFAYLHTSAWEGTPTILFDVASAMLPICAPAVGGIVDFIESEYLVDDYENVEEFVADLEELRTSPGARETRVARQLVSLRETRGWEGFCLGLANAGVYLQSSSSEHGFIAVPPAESSRSSQ